jgi:hypothetical protein
MLSIILRSISLRQWHFRLLITPWSIGCNMLVVFEGRNTSLMFSKFSRTGCAGQLLCVTQENSFDLGSADVRGSPMAVNLWLEISHLKHVC